MIVFLATQRCGSTMVCRDVASSGRLGDPREYLLPLLAKFKAGELAPDFDLKAYLQLQRPDSSIASVKIMSNQLRKLSELLSFTGQASVAGSALFSNIASYFNGSHFYYIKRQDRVAQAVSRIMAASTGIYHVFDATDPLSRQRHSLSAADGSRVERGEYNRDLIAREMKLIDAEEELIMRFLAENGIDFTLLKYEEVIEDQAYVKKIGRAVGMADISVYPRTIKKVAGSKSEEWIGIYKSELSGDGLARAPTDDPT